MAAKLLPDLATLNQMLVCDPDNGLLFWKERPLEMFSSALLCKGWNIRYAGGPAFMTLSKLGYLYGQIGRQRYLAHRIIWKMATGEEPRMLDHINGNGTDNRLSNLRNVSHSQNMRNRFLSANNKTGANGVDRWNGRYRARINHGGKTYHIGMFDTVEAAQAAQRAKALSLGFSERHGT